MKYYMQGVVIAILLTGLCTGCKKESSTAQLSSSLTLVNIIPGADTLVTNFNGVTKQPTFRYYLAQQILPNSYQEFSGYLNTVPLAISTNRDTLHALFNLNLNIAPGSIHTLFFAGTETAPDTLLTTDQVPVIPVNDSSIGIRFANLSFGSNPVNITVNTDAGDSVIASSLPYKGISSFLQLPASGSMPAGGSYTFSFIDAASSVLLTSYTLGGLSSMYFKSRTIVLKGLPGGTGANATDVLAVNHY
ncbi:hypothetical protein ACX0G9_31155 [Flavitalea flava]